jgi:hypothetical protein
LYKQGGVCFIILCVVQTDIHPVLLCQVYRKPIFTPDSYKEVYRKANKLFNSQQLYALKAIYEWRDTTARMEDEGKQ